MSRHEATGTGARAKAPAPAPADVRGLPAAWDEAAAEIERAAEVVAQYAPNVVGPEQQLIARGGARQLIDCASELRAALRHPDTCTCGHPMVVHDINKKKVRTVCSVHEGPKAIACGCLTYTPQEVT